MEAPVLEQVVRKCLAKDRNDRFDNMDGMVRALRWWHDKRADLYLNSIARRTALGPATYLLRNHHRRHHHRYLAPFLRTKQPIIYPTEEP